VQELEAAGVVRTRVGQGTFVADGADDAASRETLLARAIDRLLDEAQALAVAPEALAARVAARARTRSGSAGPGDAAREEDHR
jgi:DNA-binding transcriptional regulator YhcF (GntR family)